VRALPPRSLGRRHRPMAQEVSRSDQVLKPACLYSAGNVGARREFNALFDWRSGDWFSPNNHRLHASIAMRRYTNLGVPYDAFTCDTVFVHARPQIRARTKPLCRMLQEGATVLANGGSWGYWTYPMPHGAFVPSKMRNAKLAGEFARARRDVCLHTRSARWTAVLDAEPRAGLFGSNQAFLWARAKALIALHRAPDVIDEQDLAPDVSYDLIVAPEAADPDYRHGRPTRVLGPARRQADLVGHFDSLAGTAAFARCQTGSARRVGRWACAAARPQSSRSVRPLGSAGTRRGPGTVPATARLGRHESADRPHPQLLPDYGHGR